MLEPRFGPLGDVLKPIAVLLMFWITGFAACFRTFARVGVSVCLDG